MNRFVCIHGHFYQPPRENPWLGAIELQDSAAPYHDWNERITAECYAPNAHSRILDASGRIRQIVNNYARISFNFGPTLLSWLEEHAPDTYAALLAADRESQQRFGGHGSALAQAYNHLILPLANARDKRTQVVWGVYDFTVRFGRPPEGLWLPETAVDLESLDLLAEHGVRFTVLAPHQARRVRPLDGGSWQEVGGGTIAPHQPYLVRLPSGRALAVFFYDGPIARAVAFEGLLSNGEQFAHRLLGGFGPGDGPQLVHIATDGETYGHHHRHGDMALAYALHYLEEHGLARLTNYGEYLERFPPTHEVEIAEHTSWSCAHGVERWRADCGCASGGHPGWNQAWRGPLRAALDWLRDALAAGYERVGARYFRDPWAARNAYIAVILDRSTASVDAFLARQAPRPLAPAEQTTALKLLEMQRHALLMYTSCGWFFDELSGIETVQCLAYAGRALQLAREVFSDGGEGRYGEQLEAPFAPGTGAGSTWHAGLEAGFLDRLAAARSNLPEMGDGRQIFERFVRPAIVDLTKVAAHYAVSSLFEEYPARARVYGYTVERDDYRQLEAGRVRLGVGRARFTSTVTRESAALCFGVLHFGDHNVSGGVCAYQSEEAYGRLVEELSASFARADLAEVLRTLDRRCGSATYSLRALFRDEQRTILQAILDSTLAEAEGAYRQIYEYHAPLMRFLADLHAPLPAALRASAEFVLNTDLRRALAVELPSPEEVQRLLAEARLWGVELARDALAYVARRGLRRQAEAFREAPLDLEQLRRFEQTVAVAQMLPFEVDLWRAQNAYWAVLQQHYPARQAAAQRGDAAAATWVTAFRALGERLRVRID